MNVVGTLFDLSRQPIPHGLIQLVAVTTSSEVLQGSSVIIKADKEGCYDFELLSGSYEIYAQPSRISDMCYMGETVIASDTPDGTLNSIIGITNPVLPPQVEQALNAAKEAVNAAMQVAKDKIEIESILEQGTSIIEGATATVEQMEALAVSAGDSATQADQALDASQQIKLELDGVVKVVEDARYAVLKDKEYVVNLKTTIELICADAHSVMQEAKRHANLSQFSAENAAVECQAAYRYMMLAKKYAKESFDSKEIASDILKAIKVIDKEATTKLEKVIEISAHVDEVSQLIEENKNIALNAAEEAKVSAKAAADSEAGVKADADRSQREADRAKGEADKAATQAAKAIKQAQIATEAANNTQHNNDVSNQILVDITKINDDAVEKLSQSISINNSVAQIKEQIDTAKDETLSARDEAIAARDSTQESLNQAKEHAIAAKNDADRSAEQASISKTNAQDAAFAKDAAQNSAETATTEANRSTEQAVLSSQHSQSAKEHAELATEKAVISTQQADKATDEALRAEEIAQELHNLKLDMKVQDYSNRATELADSFNVIYASLPRAVMAVIPRGTLQSINDVNGYPLFTPRQDIEYALSIQTYSSAIGFEQTITFIERSDIKQDINFTIKRSGRTFEDATQFDSMVGIPANKELIVDTILFRNDVRAIDM